jgi:hypothetical protein
VSDCCLLRVVCNKEMLFNLALEYDFRSAQVNQNGLTNGTTQRLVYVHNICGVEAYIL